MANITDETAILAVGKDTDVATVKLERAIASVNEWTKCWRIKMNDETSKFIHFTNKKQVQIPLIINDKVLSHSNTATYLGMTLDTKLKWKEHAKKKKEELNI